MCNELEHAFTQNSLIINILWNGNIFPNYVFLILSQELSYYLRALKQKVNTVQNKSLKYKELSSSGHWTVTLF